jgi:hypothetical protein
VAAHLGSDPHPHPLSLQEAEPLLAEATAVLTLIDMEQCIRRDTCDPATWHALLEQQHLTRDGYYTGVRHDLALPPGHSAQWDPPMLRS